MRGGIGQQAIMFTMVTPDWFIRGDHRVREIGRLVDAYLVQLSPAFTRMYAKVGRPSIPPERLPKANLLMALFSVLSARRFCDQLQ